MYTSMCSQNAGSTFVNSKIVIKCNDRNVTLVRFLNYTKPRPIHGPFVPLVVP